MIDSAIFTVDTIAVAIDTTAVVDMPEDDRASIDFTSEKEVLALYEKTLENESILKKTSLKKYQAIFDFLTLEKLKNENLYDYLLKENIAFFTEKIQRWKIENSEITAYKNELLGNSEAFLET